jgi:molecular chaperone DnaJ
MTMYCSACQGTGQQSCNKCGGSGQARERKSTQINIPAGTEHNSRIKVRGEGNFEGGVYGDLVVQVSVKPHHLFEYVGNGNLRLQVTVPFTLALLGGDVSAPCIDGTMCKISIPQGVQQGYEACIRGKGIGSGFMVIKVSFEFPKTTSIPSMSLSDLGGAEYPEYQRQCKKFASYANN